MSSRPRLACATTRAGLWLRTVQSEMSGRVRSTIAAQRKSDGRAAPVRARPTSHFSAVLDQHYPQAVKISWYECSTANSRREFRTETRKSSSRAGMETLYDLLGALPKDDAEGLRTAFRQAVKGAHPDIHPDDPNAALKFREIVRANQILGDVAQRAAYDHLLDLARLEQELASKRASAARIHKFASGIMALAGASVVTVGGYLLFMHMSVASMAPANQVDVTKRASAEIAAGSPAGSSDTTGKSTSLAKYESASSPGPAIAPSAAVPSPLWKMSRRLMSAHLSISPRAPDPCERGEFPPTASATRTAATSSITSENSAVPSPTSNRRNGSKSQAVPNLPQRRPGSSTLIRPESRLRCRRCPHSERPRRIPRERRGLRW